LSNDFQEPVIIAIAGGTASGKSTLAANISKRLAEDSILITHDSYYKDQSDLPLEKRKLVNYDHPLSFDTVLMVEHLRMLKQGKSVDVPIYDFTKYTRTGETMLVKPKEIILVEGILILEDKHLRDLFDIKIFVDADADVRILRRLMRDMEERGRSIDSVVKQYLETVKPMHDRFVEPSRRFADIIIPEGGFNNIATDIIVAKIEQILRTRKGLVPSKNQGSLR